MPRFYIAADLSEGATLALPDKVARHVQVRRLQPGQALTLFNGNGGEWKATITRMGRNEVEVLLGQHVAVEREANRPVHLAVALFAADRMDCLVEKATELGAASFTPLITARSSIRLNQDRANKKQAHWQAIAAAACAQCGRNRLLEVHAPISLTEHLAQWSAAHRWVLSPEANATPVGVAATGLARPQELMLLSGPEGGLDDDEASAAGQAGYLPVQLGPRILRAETAPLAALSILTA